MKMTVSPKEIADFIIAERGYPAAHHEVVRMIQLTQDEKVLSIWQKVYFFIEMKNLTTPQEI